MPRASSVGWFGCRRTAMVPGQADRVAEPRHHPAFAGDGDEVLVAHDLGDGRRHLRRDARCQRREAFVVAASDSSQSRKPPTVRCETGAKAAASWLSRISRVTSSVS
jgi:hypothetical protein